MKLYIYLYYGKITCLKLWFHQQITYFSLLEIVRVHWSIYLGNPALKIRRDQFAMWGRRGCSQPSNWSNENSLFSPISIVANYYIIILLFILYFISFLNYQDCFSHWRGTSQLFAALTGCSRCGWWITSLCLLALCSLPILPNFC